MEMLNRVFGRSSGTPVKDATTYNEAQISGSVARGVVAHSEEQVQSAKKAAEILKGAKGVRGTKRKINDASSPIQSETARPQPAQMSNRIQGQQAKNLSRPKRAKPMSSQPPRGKDVFEIEVDHAPTSTSKTPSESHTAQPSKNSTVQDSVRASSSQPNSAEDAELEPPHIPDSPAQNTRRKTRQGKDTTQPPNSAPSRTSKAARGARQDKGGMEDQESLNPKENVAQNGASRPTRGRPPGKKRRLGAQTGHVNGERIGDEIALSGVGERAEDHFVEGRHGSRDAVAVANGVETDVEDQGRADNTAEEHDETSMAPGGGKKMRTQAWVRFTTLLAKIQDNKAHHNPGHLDNRSDKVRSFIKTTKHTVTAYSTIKEAADPFSPAVVEAERVIEGNLPMLSRTQAKLSNGLQIDKKHKKQLGRDIYLEIIPSLSELLVAASEARKSNEGDDISSWEVSSLTELLTLMGFLESLCYKAYKWQPSIKLQGIVGPTRSLGVSTVSLHKVYKKARDLKLADEVERHLAKQRTEAEVAYRAKVDREQKEHQAKCEQRWAEILEELEERQRPVRAAEPRYRGTATPDRDVNDIETLSPAPVRDGVSFVTPEPGEEEDLLPRTPLTARSQRVTFARDVPKRPLMFGSGEEREWEAEEEGALINGLQEYQGPSRYFDIFNAYSGRELAGRDMDAIERKAKSLKAALINEMKGTRMYDEFGFLWSVAD